MKCDGCLNEIDEKAGFVTFSSKHEGTLTYRNQSTNQLITRIITSGGETRRFCYSCSKTRGRIFLEGMNKEKGEEK